MTNIKTLLKEVLEDIQPDKGYEKEIFEKLNGIIRKISQNQKGIKAILGGSGAKGTWLKTFDADIFALFDYRKYSDKSEKLSDILEAILKKKFKKIIRLHGSRDYFQIKESNFTFEIVPILKIKKAEQARNITDVSPLHSGWVKKHKKLANEMKLAKQFCQAQNVYGAESYIMGFSGYVCEVLTAYYGSFLGLMRNAAKWKGKVIVDAGKYYKGKDVFRLVNTSKLASPLIVIDPVQKGRNASAALSNEKFEAFKTAAKEFLKSPSREFFVRKGLVQAFAGEKAKNNRIIVIKAMPLPGKPDIAGSKLMKAYGFLIEQLRRHDFSIIKSGWEWDGKNVAFFCFLFDKKPLPKTIELEGPPLSIKQHADNFKNAHKKTFARSGRLFAVENRKFLAPEDLLRSAAAESFVKERVKSVKMEIL